MVLTRYRDNAGERPLLGAVRMVRKREADKSPEIGKSGFVERLPLRNDLERLRRVISFEG
jgi:hypothetical protein